MSSDVLMQNQPKSSSSSNKSSIHNQRKKCRPDKSSRKRTKSFTGFGSVLPTKFLLGGNINDPLNLNSLQDEEVNRAVNAFTPKSSPIPTPPRRKEAVEVMIHSNVHDPLHLIDCTDDAQYEQQLSSPVKKARRKRLKRRRTDTFTINSDSNTTSTSEQGNQEESVFQEISDNEKKTDESLTKEQPDPLPEDKKDKKEDRKRKTTDDTQPVKRFKHSLDKIVSPVVPQPGAWLKRTNSVLKPMPKRNNSVDTAPVFKEENKKFQYGNYNRYYGYRNPHNAIDPRLRLFSQHMSLFENKNILDIGCNIGHITLSIARDFNARSVTGIDIDSKLISIARKNIKHYVKAGHSPMPSECNGNVRKKNNSEFFPISMPILYGAIDIPGHCDNHDGNTFPSNVSFKQCNYVVEDENLLSLEQPQYDTILCLSVTKWIHLNYGDNGLKLAFRRMYEQLKPGGKLILEAQGWSSYKTKKKLTETLYKNYNEIELFPSKFQDYLFSPAVGFAKCEILKNSEHKYAGFKRPILIFTKSTMFPSERVAVTPMNGSSTSDPKVIKDDNNSQPEHIYTDLIGSINRDDKSEEVVGLPDTDSCETKPEDNQCVEDIASHSYSNDLSRDIT